jgi:hypothetical protein
VVRSAAEADFVLICAAERFPAHKVIVCSQSKVFHAACSKPFRVSKSIESTFPSIMTNVTAGGGIGGVRNG